MLGFLSLFSLRATAAFLLLSVLIARAWGWSEYASLELYVVYYQLTDQRPRYFIINADGTGTSEPLVWGNEPINKVDCSPDGRVFAFVTDDGAFYSVTPDGVTERGVEDRAYITINVADDRTIALFDPVAGLMEVNGGRVQLSDSEQPNLPMDRIDISPQGLVLWTRQVADIQVVAPETGEVIAIMPRASLGMWLAAGQIFTFYDPVPDDSGILMNGGQYVMDLGAQKSVRVGTWTTTRPLSPDGTQVAAALVQGIENRKVQVVVYDLLTSGNRHQLTFDPTTASQPICFLAFRPAELVENNS